MNGVPHPRWSAGRGRGQSMYEFWEDRPGRNPGTSHVRRDPVSNNFKLHVRSIPSNWNLTIFQNVFSRCGEPKNIYMHPHRGPNTLTWGFVEFENYQEASNAVRELNNNIMLNIQVSFAREKVVEEEFDPILQLLSSEHQEDMSGQYRSTESLVDPRTLVKTVKNTNTFSSEILIEDFYKPVLDLETQRCVEEALFQKILDIYKAGDGSTAKCNVCEASCSMACSGCTSVFYCSEDCQNRDWASHSRNCKGASSGTSEDTMMPSRGGGDQRPTRSEFTNGHGSERENRSDNRTDRFADRRNNRDGDRGNQRDRGQRMERNGNDQPEKRTLFEERKARMASSSRQNENDRGFQNRFGQNNQRSSNNQETKNSFKPKTNAELADEDWGCRNQDSDVKDSSATTPGLDFINKEKAFLQEVGAAKEVKTAPAATIQKIKDIKQEANVAVPVVPVAGAVNVNTTAEEQLPQPGLVLKVVIILPEGRGLFWVQDQKTTVADIVRKLEEHFRTCSSQFSPVQDGICGILYEGKWYRCQISNLDPLTVFYIDFGYPETVEASRLFELSVELKSMPPSAFKIKMVDGTPNTILDLDECDKLVVKLIEKVDNYWLAQAVDEQMPDLSVAVTTSNPPVTMTTPAPTAEVSTKPAPVDQAQPQAEPQQQPAATQQAVTTSDPPVTVTTPAPTAEVSTEPAPVDQAQPQAEPQQQPAATQQAVQQPFPPLFDSTGFTTVLITYPGDTEQKDTYYVGATTLWTTLGDMSNYFTTVIDRCEVLTPRHGAKGLAKYLDVWYRVKVVSLTPLLAYYIDYGNIEPIEPEGLRKCPETHADVPNLVHKIKLAPGTNEKYFSLPLESHISVKPVSWLADCTIVVEVEGENYTELPRPIQVVEDPSSPAIAPATAPGSSSPSASISDAPPQPNHPSPDGTDLARQATASSGPSALVDLTPSKPPSTVDLLQEKWKISFVPYKVDFVKNSLFGQVYTKHISETISFVSDNDKFQNYLSDQKLDPNFRPNAGEIVGLRIPSGDFERGKVLSQQGLVALYDMSGVTRCSQLFKLPESFVNIPTMAAVLTLRKEDPELLSFLSGEDEIIFDVVEVLSDKGFNVVPVTNNTLRNTGPIEGELRTWDYEPLETPDPLAPGDSVTIVKVIDSNTLLVTPANDLEIQQAIQIDCRKTCEDFKSPPKEGDYVSFLDKESDGYFRCKIDKVEGDAFSIYSVDNATYHQAKLGDLHPLPGSLRNVPCRVTQIELKDVDKVVQTEQAQVYLSHIVEEDKLLTFDIDNSSKATLTVEGKEVTLNQTLKDLLKPQIVPNSEGKLTVQSLPELRVPLNQTFSLVVCHEDPLYVQIVEQPVKEFHGVLHPKLQAHCEMDKVPYNPCEGELCLARFIDETWYRCRCLEETNTGESTLKLVDFGNIFTAKTQYIRKILPEMLTLPSIAIPCKINGLPDPVSPALKAKLEELLAVDTPHSGVFVAENEGCYEVVIEDVKKAIQELQ